MPSSITSGTLWGMEVKIRENRLRRMAERQELRLVKSRRRDPRALGYGGYMLVDWNNRAVAGEVDSDRALELDEVEAWLDRKIPPERMAREQRDRMHAAGLFWDGLGSWVQNLPKLTVHVPGPSRAQRRASTGHP